MKYQEGLGAIGWLCALALVAFVATCVVNMAPAYSENLLVKSALKSLADDSMSVDRMSKMQIREKLIKFYTVNDVRGPAAENLEVERQRDRTLVKVNYEVRKPLFYNVSVVMTFNNVYDSSRPAACCSPPSDRE